VGRNGCTAAKTARCETTSRHESHRRICARNRIQAGIPKSLREVAETAYFEAIRENVAPAFALREHLEGRRLRYPDELSRYAWLLQLVARARVERSDHDAWVSAAPLAQTCPIPHDMGRFDVCLVHPEAADLVAVQAGVSGGARPRTTRDTWYLVSLDYFDKHFAAHAHP
jgi:hypothetical protein